MNLDDKVNWMLKWCLKHNCQLNLDGECGFGRPCVGIMKHDLYPDYPDPHWGNWYVDEINFDVPEMELSGRETVWTPEDAYHKHPCVAVLNYHDKDKATEQLYDWLKWFDDNGYEIEVERKSTVGLSEIELILGKHISVKMVKGEEVRQENK